ncbi:RTA1 like protein-domain-containing protein [Xylariaceae sp. FL0804]|nr:RTA1 like protein-domain-containing protein [Xylariaceae sp. FL0804]
MVGYSDFTTTCVAGLDPDTCTPQTCCLHDYGKIQYLPSIAGNGIYAGLLVLMLLPNTFFGIKFRTWSFFGWMTLGLIGETIGYVGRIGLHQNIFSFTDFIVYLVPLTIAPAFISASVYLCFARLVLVLDPALEASHLKPMTYTKIFVAFDVASLLLQSGGGAIAAEADTTAQQQTGVNVMIAGLAIQVISLVIFALLCAEFAWRLKRRGGPRSGSASGARGGGSKGLVDSSYDSDAPGAGARERFARITERFVFKGFVGAVGTAVVLIIIRSIYRLIELQSGFDGAIANNQTVFMILEGPMIILSVGGLMAFHPGLVFRELWSMGKLRPVSAQAAEDPHAQPPQPLRSYSFGRDGRGDAAGVYGEVRS